MTEQIAAGPLASPDAPLPAPLHYARPADAPDEAPKPLSRGDAAAMVLKIFGVYSLIQSLPLILSALEWMSLNRMHSAIPNLVLAAIYLGLGILLLARGPSLVGWLLPRTAIGTPEPLSSAPTQLQAIAFSVVGVLLVIWSVPSLMYYFVSMMLEKSRLAMPPASYMSGNQFWGDVVSKLFEAVLGVWLFFGSKGLAVWWSQLRHPEFQMPQATPPTLPEPQSVDTTTQKT